MFDALMNRILLINHRQALTDFFDIQLHKRRKTNTSSAGEVNPIVTMFKNRSPYQQMPSLKPIDTDTFPQRHRQYCWLLVDRLHCPLLNPQNEYNYPQF